MYVVLNVFEKDVLSDPIFLDFGRLAEWNCPTEGGSVTDSRNEVGTEGTKKSRPRDR